MAFNIVAMTSFDNYASSDLPKFFNLGYGSDGINTNTANTPFGTGRSALFANTSSSLSLVNTTTKLAASCYFYRNGADTGHNTFAFIGLDGILGQTTVVADIIGYIKIQSGTLGGTTLASTVAPVVFPGFWYHIEVKLTCTTNSSANDCQVWLNGVLVLSLGSGLSTRGGTSNTRYTGLTVYGSSVYVDDLIVYDWSSGDSPPMGQCRVTNLSPNGNGTTSDFLGSDADSTNNYLLVSDIPINTATYTGSSASGLDLYAMANLSTTPASIIGVQVSSIMTKTDVGAIIVRNVIRSGGTNYSGADCVVTPSYQQFSDRWIIDPNTSSNWTVSSVNAIEAGVSLSNIYNNIVSGSCLTGGNGLIGKIYSNTGSGGCLAGGDNLIVYAYDTFTASDATNLTSHTMDIGSGWTAHRGTWQIFSNRAVCSVSAGDDQCIASTDAGYADVTITAILTAGEPSNLSVRLACNVVDADNHWLMYCNYDGTNYGLFVKVAGAYTQHAAGTVPAIAFNTNYPVTLKCSGDDVYCTLQGVTLHANVASRPHKTATRHGIGQYNLTYTTTDNFLVEPYS